MFNAGAFFFLQRVHRIDNLNSVNFNLSLDQLYEHHLVLLWNTVHNCIHSGNYLSYKIFVWIVHILECIFKILLGQFFEIGLCVQAVVSNQVQVEARSFVGLAAVKKFRDFFVRLHCLDVRYA